jgi:hypothetical protein
MPDVKADAQRLLGYREAWPELLRDEFTVTLEPYQATVLRALATNSLVAWSAGRGCGKTFTAASAALCYLMTRVPAKVLLVGPQHDNHIVNGIIPQIHQILVRSPLASEMFSVQTASISARLDALKRSHLILGLAAETPEFLAGHHSPHLMIVCEEAANLPRAAFIALLGSLTSEGGDQKFFMSSTPPLLRAGFFWSAFEDAAA